MTDIIEVDKNRTIILTEDLTSEIITVESPECVITREVHTELIVDESPFNLISECRQGPPGPPGPAGDGGDVLFTDARQTPYAQGGISSGSTFDEVSVLELWRDFLYPYLAPSFTSFSISGQASLLEVGQALTGGVKTFTWSTSNSENVTVDTIEIKKSSTVLLTASANDGVEDVDIGADIIRTSLYTDVWTIYGTSIKDVVFSRTISVSWRWRVFYGYSENTTLTETEIEALVSSTLKNSRSGTYQVTPAGYKYVAWPLIFGTFNTMKDPDTNQDVAVNLPETVSITNQYGVTADYYLYRTTYYQNGALTMVVT